MVNNVFLIALVTEVFLNTSKVDGGASRVELRCVVNRENVERRCCRSGGGAVCDAVDQLNRAVVIGISSEGITGGGITINAACISGVDGEISDGKRITVAIGESIEELLFCKASSESSWMLAKVMEVRPSTNSGASLIDATLKL